MIPGFVTFIIFVLALGGMIFLHELGHFIAARWAKIQVEEFGFGLPSKKLITLFTWQGTEFTIHALPLGGFVRIKGENDPNVPGGLSAASPWKRLVVLFAGPIMNLLTAVIVFALLLSFQGVPVPGSVAINAVSPASPASQSGLLPGDILLAINGESFSEIEQAVALIKNSLDQPIELLVERNGKKLTLSATPLSSRTPQQGALGVSLGYPTRPATLLESLSGGLTYTALQSASILYLPVGLIMGAIDPQEARLVGFKGIFDMFDMALNEDINSRQPAASSATAAAPAPQQPTHWTLNLVGILSVSLGIMNLLPIPALDGGRILFTLPEILFRKRIPPEHENLVNGIAMLLLIGLMLFVNLMDFINPAKLPTP